MLNDYLRAWHAGLSKWGNLTDVNSSSIGIELDNDGFQPFADAQINSLLKLLASLKTAYNIPAANFIGHGDIAPTRKNDPNVLFPWKMLVEKGFGNWYDDTTNIQMPFISTIYRRFASSATTQRYHCIYYRIQAPLVCRTLRLV